MEQEESYKSAQSKVNNLTIALTSLNEFSFAKALSDVHKDIENHFEIVLKALQQRKEHLLSTVDKLAQELLAEKQIATEKIELTDKIQATNKIVEYGALLYTQKCDMALEIWKKTDEIVHVSETKGLRVNFSPLLDNINSHGTVFIGVLPPKIKGSTAQKYKAFVSRAPIKDHERQASQKGYERVADILDTEKQYGWVNQQRYIHETEKNKKNIDTLEEDSSREKERIIDYVEASRKRLHLKLTKKLFNLYIKDNYERGK